MVKNPNEGTSSSIHAVIGVWHRGARTFYVKRSAKMQNYPLVWSLLSIQFDPRVVRDHLDVPTIQPLMTKMADDRLRSAPIRVTRYLSSANCADNPMSRRVFLHLYEVEFETEPKLAPEFYVDAAWLDPDEYERRAAGTTCGLCLRMWSDHCVRHGMTRRFFAPSLSSERDEATA
jgi:hypothetical protein